MYKNLSGNKLFLQFNCKNMRNIRFGAVFLWRIWIIRQIDECDEIVIMNGPNLNLLGQREKKTFTGSALSTPLQELKACFPR